MSKGYYSARIASRLRACVPGLHLKLVARPNKTIYGQQRLFSVLLRGAPEKLTSSYYYKPSNDPLLGLTVGQLLDAVTESASDHEAVVSCAQNIRKTFADLKKESDNLAAGLVGLGLKRHDRVAVWGHNTYEWIVCMFALAKAGLIMVALNPAYKAEELEYSLKKVQVKALIVSEDFGPLNYTSVLDAVLPERNTSKSPIITIDRFPDLKFLLYMHPTRQTDDGRSNRKDGISIQDLSQGVSHKDHEKLVDRQKEVTFDDPGTIMFTSGTTGLPKAAVLSHHNVVNNSYLAGIRMGFDKYRPRYCMPAPLFHCMGSVVGTITPMTHLGTVVLPSPLPNPLTSLQAIQEERCKNLLGSPTMYIDILRHPEFDKFDISSLETGLVGGASCLQEVLREMKDRLKLKVIGTGYGTTENSPVISVVSRYDSEDRQLTTVGQPLQNTEVKITAVDSEQVLPVNTPGEVCSRGHHVFLGYWDDPEKTNEVVTPSKWYRTGDIGVMDEDGYVKIVGRIKDMIIRGGENVYPVEIENFLHKHTAIAEAHVFGVPDTRLGEEICVWIKLKEGQSLTEQEVKDFCKGKISYFKVPKYVLFTDVFPLTASGKVQKNKLRDETIERLKLPSK